VTFEIDGRRHWMSVLARSHAEDVNMIWESLAMQPDFVWLDEPEFTSVMVRARAGSNGTLFNLGEVVTTTCRVLVNDKAAGTACIVGRDKRHAAIAALFDALLANSTASPRRADFNDAISWLDQRLELRAQQAAAKTLTTRVDFTMTVAE
jgi:alpha-D-ribose 1-methylphosphonate 5-triphosphate synthase subunit PhnG